MFPPTDLEPTRPSLLSRRPVRWALGSLLVSVPLGAAAALLHPALILASVGGFALLAMGVGAVVPDNTDPSQPDAPMLGFDDPTAFRHARSRERGASFLTYGVLPLYSTARDGYRASRTKRRKVAERKMPIVAPPTKERLQMAGGLSVANAGERGGLTEVEPASGRS